MGSGDFGVVGDVFGGRGREERWGGGVSVAHSASPDEERRPWRGGREERMNTKYCCHCSSTNTT